MSNAHSISLAAAAAMTSRFRANLNTVLKTVYENIDILATCETFERSAIEDVLNQQSCTALRIYYGMDEDLKIHAILVGVNQNGADILPVQSALTEEDTGEILEEGQRCPPYCPPASPLNSD